MGVIKRKRKKLEGKLNITSMMDMFTIILVFLLKSFSSSGQLVAPVEGLTIPSSTIERNAKAALEINVSLNRDSSSTVSVEGKKVATVSDKGKKEGNDLLIPELLTLMQKYAEEARSMEKLTNKEFKGDVLLQGDINIDYRMLVRIMYTCGQAGFPNLNLIVYREE
ncbi:MAG: ExbD/TolR family protein [Fibrobacterota bacterium]